MSSSSINNSFYDTDNIIAREHLSNFHNLPFHIYFTSPYSPLPPHLTTLNLPHFTTLNLNASFQQIPAHSVPTPSSPPPQRLILVATEYHYRYIIDRRPTRIPISNHSSSDSLPPLIPVTQSTISQSTHTPSIQPIQLPSYDSSFQSSLHTINHSNPPDYQPPSEGDLLRRITELERSAIHFRNTVIDNRNLTISRLYADTDAQITDHQEQTNQEIRRCEELLYFHY